jgi:two-component system CheB/CheR fusion protein
VVVDERWDVVHLSDSVGRFLRVAGGEPSHRLLDLARADLRSALRTSVHQAFELGQPTSRVVRMQEDDGELDVRLEVRPSGGRGAATGGRFALITFEESKPKAEASPRPPTNRQDVAELEKQLGQMREQLEAARADHDHSVAELQIVNEELLSINEEQKAAVEELETGREEIQAINEELTTINQEHQSTIDELKRTNADLQNLIESTEIGTIFVDLQLRIRRFTPAVCAVFNFVPTDVGRPLGDITHRLDYPDLIVDVTGVLQSLERREREVGSSGNEWFIVRINPYRSHDGHVDGAVLTFFDHTARRRLEDELREAKLVAEAGNAAKDRFLSTLSHELRTPLSGIMGYAEILGLDAPLTAEQEKRVERIRVGGRHLDAMIGQLLDFSRLDSNQVSLKSEPVDARAVLNDVHQLMRPLAGRKELVLSVEVPETVIALTTDADKARQVLMNLCANAIKYTAVGQVSLCVRELDDRVVFEVGDTGPGIAPQHHAKIFERFWQVDGGATRRDSGLGIGLAAAREYARLLGGDVEVESRLGEGAIFRFWLPSTPAPMPDARSAPTTAEPAAAEAPTHELSGRTV